MLQVLVILFIASAVVAIAVGKLNVMGGQVVVSLLVLVRSVATGARRGRALR